MHEGTWTLRPCPRPEVESLAHALGISEVTATVLVRRGYGDPEDARTFLAAERHAHDPFLLGDMARGLRGDPRRRCSRHAHLRARRLRRRRHLRDGPRGAGARAARSERGLASAEPVRGGLRVSRARRSPGSRTKASGSSSPWTAASRRSMRSPTRRRAGSRSSSRTITGPATGCPTARSWRPGPPTTRSRSSAGQASPTSSPRRLSESSRRRAPRSRGARDGRRRRAAARREPRPRRRRPAPARSYGEAGPGRAHALGGRRSRRRSTPAPSAFGWLRASTPPVGSGTRARPCGSCSRTTPQEARQLAGELEVLNRDRQAVEDAMLRAAMRQIAEWPEPRRQPARLRARGARTGTRA